jgi:acetyl esterase/lipase
MFRLRHVVLAVCVTVCLAGCGQHVKTYAIPPSTYHTAQQFVDLQYAPSSAKERLDLKIPAGSRSTPLVIIVHGGWWVSGDKGLPDVTATKRLLAAGYAVALVNYRLGSEAMFPAAVRDVKAAVRWLRAHASTYYLEADKFAVWGQDAGGYLAIATGLTGGQQTIFDGTGLGDEGVSSAVQAVIAWRAPVDFGRLDADARAAGCSVLFQNNAKATDSYYAGWLGGSIARERDRTDQADLLKYVGSPEGSQGSSPGSSQGNSQEGSQGSSPGSSQEGLPAFQIVQAAGDCVVPPRQGQALADAVRGAGGSATVVTVKGLKTTAPDFTRTQIQPGIDFLGKTFS